MLELLDSDYPQDIIENQINERLRKRLFKMWWETGDGEYFDALKCVRDANRSEYEEFISFVIDAAKTRLNYYIGGPQDDC